VSSYLYVILAISFVGIGLAHADIRQDIASLKAELNSLEDLIETLGNNIVSQKDIIKEKERLYYDAKNNEKKERDEVGDSWTSFEEHDDAVADLMAAEKEFNEAKAKLQLFYNQRNEAIQKATVIENEIKFLDDLPTPKVRDEPGRLFGISLDQTCITKIKNNVSGVCPTYEEIDLFFPSIDCEYPGALCLNYHRQTGNGKGYIVNPEAAIREKISTVEIRGSFEEYQLKGILGYDDANHTLTYNLGRYVENCDSVFIDAAQWLTLLGDSIMYLDSDCSKTYHTQERYEYINQTKHDITTSYKWQLDQWIKDSKIKCKEKCFEY